uniref:hypothetical protein n=1 Tax=uncultured Halovibrio sp. TaxID=985049 RepID=UPI0025F2FE0B
MTQRKRRASNPQSRKAGTKEKVSPVVRESAIPKPDGLLEAKNQLKQARGSDSVLAAAKAVLQIEPTDPDAMDTLGQLQMLKGHARDATETLARALFLQPNNEALLERYIRAAAKAGLHWDALCVARHWVSIATEKPAAATRLLAGLYGLIGKEDISRQWAYEAARLDPLSVAQATDQSQLSILVLSSIASGSYIFQPKSGSLNTSEGHNNLPSLLDTMNTTRYRLHVDAIDEINATLKNLPKVDVIYNGITDPERCRQALVNADRLCERLYSGYGIPVINNPKRVLECTRENNAQRGADWEGVIVPKSVHLGLIDGEIGDTVRETARNHGLKEPIIMRAAGYQGGKNMHLIDDLENLKVRLQSPTEVYLIEYIDTQSDDGLFWKYRAFLVGEKLWPGSVIASKEWVSNRAASREDASLAEKMHQYQKVYQEDPEQVIGTQAWADLRNALIAIGLEYCGVDYGLSK